MTLIRRPAGPATAKVVEEAVGRQAVAGHQVPDFNRGVCRALAGDAAVAPLATEVARSSKMHSLWHRVPSP